MQMQTLTAGLLAAMFAMKGLAQQPAGHADHMEHRFDNATELAAGFDDPKRDAWQMPERVVEALHLKPGSAVADVGAGTGYFSVRLARASARPAVFSCDIEPNMVKYLSERAGKEGLSNMKAVRASATSPNLPGAVDVVLVVDTYHHIGNRGTYFRELQKNLKPGGRVAIVDFRVDSPEGPPREFRFSKDQIAREMAGAGYVMAAEHTFLPRQLFLIFEVKSPAAR